ncbi:helix-turn-helix domain-containing protein [Polaromonas sp. YR568]|uniref:helix-turn-helix domain-containing protein n=1 Tax=Polaromonas sp. YR568 TaxID=1855301 RepID=UPI0020C912C8|nr:helix-turn-helix domain-containing protein [Polaromonas sp. YR568]
MTTNKSTPSQEDMHPADVIAALRKRGTSLRRIAIENGYSHIQRVLTSPWLAAEQLVARALDKRPQDVWPSRYVNPDDRWLAFKQTRRITVTNPSAPPGDDGSQAQAGGPDASPRATPRPAQRHPE